MEEFVRALEHVTPLLDQLPLGVQFVDEELRYRYLNQRAAEHGRTSITELVGRTMGECYPGIEQTEVYQKICETLLSGHPHSLESFFEFPDGASAWFDIQTYRVGPGVVITSFDISKQKSLEIHHRQAQRMDATRHLAGGIAHHFNNLLTIIGSFTELVIEDENLSEEQREHLGEVLNATYRASEVTSNLLTLSRHARSSPKNFELAEHLQALLPSLAASVGQDVQLEVQVPSELGTVRLDPTTLEQVLVSIALNAQAAMSEPKLLRISASITELDPSELGGATLTEQRPEDAAVGTVPALPAADVAPTRRYAEIAISDNGPGMREDELEKLFDPVLSRNTTLGTGLGMGMCWSLVEQAGGTIHVETKRNRGTIFRVLLPITAEAQVTSNPSSPSLGHVKRRAKILVVDDEPGIRTVVIRHLESYGHACIAAEDGIAALERLDEHHDVDLIISDVLMPRMSGMELAKRLEKAERHPAILLMSGYSPEDVSVHLDRRWTMLTKPFSARRLLEAVDEAL